MKQKKKERKSTCDSNRQRVALNKSQDTQIKTIKINNINKILFILYNFHNLYNLEKQNKVNFIVNFMLFDYSREMFKNDSLILLIIKLSQEKILGPI